MLDKSKLSKLSSKSDENTNVSQSEIARFDLLAESWWDPNGKYKTALIFNQARIDYFVPQICKHFNRDIDDENCLAGLSVLDVGSGGGLVCEPLAKLGANVTGIDASEMSVEVARRHAQKTGLNIHYQHILSTDKLKEGKQFDIVINAEVVEHVPDQKALIAECAQLTANGGFTILATLNRTPKSFVIAIIGAEYIMRYLPIGTHSWAKFVKPVELNQMAVVAGLQQVSESGMAYNPLSGKWRLSNSLAVNYIQCYKKNK
ncbi:MULTISPECIES: bifunctional 2-polyprenyl-6-hydroxyphenol methylase/3-demethylubiquinol 3-O-methyltransferase UbiG [Alteromonadaceae]|jgi:2-polyprenyl-6-hydroxyphenyl methylase/3-demethylubiquinone-9 3-methyltransferase|uniref:Ubiquinone biosynthesis O-methyltransferase n=1 Tax=Brumicola blandensis TaxID=3075611 RepID=A0AAW8R2X0_9ALTE|nr:MULTISPECIES: bifunctional 2-polyprenyl-6-hydroxyphenol methylase/3-demethylubiquinol 3-O-methyltransferase UbiG [unclassified Alteromonas]MDT0583532.1 bifunctional 2-polyprenyl-6-hydroxyphenol methylase/3-demethylubiquinol 3-O-methyltransferase UbiG [Alteromonas sp. W409]MDT0629467.1 bifunctional 2-polyprenyl-6-hydroxyphenol methylase/3-demethylubiquinol 3-O-methyltransferase UbiG [Alteromonas sp. W364]